MPHARPAHENDEPLGFFTQLAIAFHGGTAPFGEVAANPAHSAKIAFVVLGVGVSAGIVTGGDGPGAFLTTALVLAGWCAMSVVALVVGRAFGDRSPTFPEVVRGVGFACFPGLGVLFALAAGTDMPGLRPAILWSVGVLAAVAQIFAAHEMFRLGWPRAVMVGGCVALVGAIPFAALYL